MANVSFFLRRRLIAFRPTEQNTIYLNREYGQVKIKNAPKSFKKNDCVNLMVTWIKSADTTLSISLFSVLHKKTVKALIKKQRSGVRCRVVLYRGMCDGPKRDKLLRYAEKLTKAGVQLRWLPVDGSETGIDRMILIDCLKDLSKGPLRYTPDAGIITGDQSVSQNQDISIDLHDVKLTKSNPDDTASWRLKYYEAWSKASDEY